MLSNHPSLDLSCSSLGKEVRDEALLGDLERSQIPLAIIQHLSLADVAILPRYNRTVNLSSISHTNKDQDPPFFLTRMVTSTKKRTVVKKTLKRKARVVNGTTQALDPIQRID